ncbi:hypothetical protein RHSIM_Rhsim09G0209400 [Rhododendron simsii]|uniref:RRM domain-containing protein n=1 Tax=Rhododendron simsii TaxID=118357 RepID=A0A834GDS7_RHOSS|nr:hypothetical protein RHSIM_Rhsim09G0209400 [Rhododendron simsii]
MSGRFSRMIYVGNLPADIREWEVEDLFYKYGRILDIELKIPPRPPCYCFVEFENSRDAEDAIRGRDGYNFDGCRLRVELAHGGRGPSSSSDRRSGYSGSGGGGGGGSAGRYGISRHSEFRVIVRGLPSSASWQDLKDHMRKAGDVCFAEVSRDSDGTFGLVDYTNYEDMKYAIRKLDDTEFKNPWTRSYIRVTKYEDSPSRSRSRSRSPRRNRSKSLERSVSRSGSKSRSPSPVKASSVRRPNLATAAATSNSAQFQADKIAKLVKAANVDVESYWPSLFTKLVEKRNIEDLILNVGSGGGGGGAVALAAPSAGGAAAAAPAAAAVEEKKEEPKEESDDDMGFSLFD